MRRPVPAAAWLLPTMTVCGGIGLLAPNPVIAGALSAAVAVPVGAAQVVTRRRQQLAEHRAEQEALAARADAAHAAWLDGDTTKDEEIVAGSTALIQALLDAPKVTPAQVARIEEEFAHPAGPLRCNLASLRRDLLEEETPRADLGEPTSVGAGGCLQWMLPEHVRPLPAEGHRMVELTRGHRPGELRTWEEQPIPTPKPEPPVEVAPEPEPEPPVDWEAEFRLKLAAEAKAQAERAAAETKTQLAEIQEQLAAMPLYRAISDFKQALVGKPLSGSIQLAPVEDYAVVHEWGVLDRVRVDRVTRRYPHL